MVDLRGMRGIGNELKVRDCTDGHCDLPIGSVKKHWNICISCIAPDCLCVGDKTDYPVVP